MEKTLLTSIFVWIAMIVGFAVLEPLAFTHIVPLIGIGCAIHILLLDGLIINSK